MKKRQTGYRCALKSFAKKTNITTNPGRSYVPVTRAPTPPPSNEALCATNTGVLAVQNATAAGSAAFLDLFVYNHASFADAIVDCNITVSLSAGERESAMPRKRTPTFAM